MAEDPEHPRAGAEDSSNEPHVTPEQMELLLRGELPPRETRLTVRHLLSLCPHCVSLAQEATARLGFFQPNPLKGALASVRPRTAGKEKREESDESKRYDTILDRTRRRALPSTEEILVGEQRARERLHALGLCAALERNPPVKRLHMVRKFRRFHRQSLYQRLLERCIEEGRQFPQSAIDLATLALAVVDTLDPERCPGTLVADLKGRGFASLGNAKRLAADFEGSREAFREARSWLMAGSGDPLEEARVVSLEASLQKDLGEIEASVAHLDRAIELYRDAGDAHLQGRTMIQQANTLGELDPERVVSMLQHGLSLIDAEREPRLKLCALHDMIWHLVSAGHPREALHLLDECRTLYRQFPDAWTRLRLWWVEARIARALGDLAAAEDTFRAVWYEFDERGMYYELTLVSIDLAEIYVAAGKAKQAARLLREFGAVLEQWGMHREGLAAWGLLEQATKTEQFLEIARYFSRSWRMPARFIQPAG